MAGDGRTGGPDVTREWKRFEIKDGEADYFREADDMELNRGSERRVFYRLTGVAPDVQSIRRVAKRCLDQEKACANLRRG